MLSQSSIRVLLCVTFDELGDVPVDGLGELLVGGVARPWHYLQSKPGQQHTIQPRLTQLRLQIIDSKGKDLLKIFAN